MIVGDFDQNLSLLCFINALCVTRAYFLVITVLSHQSRQQTRGMLSLMVQHLVTKRERNLWTKIRDQHQNLLVLCLTETTTDMVLYLYFGYASINDLTGLLYVAAHINHQFLQTHTFFFSIYLSYHRYPSIDHHFDHGRTPIKLDQRSRSFEHPPLDRQSNLSRSSTRISSVPESTGRLPHLSSMPYVTTSEQQRSSKISNNTLKEPTQEVSRPVSRSREAAASAMLELKSAGQYRSLPKSPTHHVSQAPSQPPHKVQTTHSASKFAGTIVPLDSSRQNFKWSIEGQSYIVSASGVQALEPVSS